MLSDVTCPKPMLLVCEDGVEYTARFSRFLSDHFSFERVTDFASALRLLQPGHRFEAIVLDLDFARSSDAQLVDEHGYSAPSLPRDLRQRLAAEQGILILRRLRLHGIETPAVLFADLEDPARVGFLEQALAPLSILTSSTGLPQLLQQLEAMRNA